MNRKNPTPQPRQPPHIRVGLGQMRKNPRVARTRPVLYHGTSGAALPKIRAKGILPRATHSEWLSPHSTVTTTATFLVDDIVIAFFYAAGEHRYRPEARREQAAAPVILEVDPTKIKKPLHPDYDDAKWHIASDLSELFRFTAKKFEIGQRLTSRQAEMIEDALTDLQAEFERPLYLSVTTTPAGVPYLTAEPWVGFPVHAHGAEALELLGEAEEVSWVDGDPMLFARQYLVQGSIPPSAIVGAWQACREDESDLRIENLALPLEDGSAFEWIYLRRLPW